MKILYVYKALAIWGGIERVLVDKMNYLSENKDNSIFIITTEQGSHNNPYLMNDRITHIDLGMKFQEQYKYHRFKRIVLTYKNNRLFKNEIKRTIINIQPDIIICVAELYVDTLVKTKGNVPLIIESHSIYDKTLISKKYNLFKKLRRHVYMHYFKKADAIVALTKNDAKKWSIKFKNVIAIPNVVHLNNTGSYTTCVNHSIIFVGRMAQQKGLNSLIEIWKQIIIKHPDWELNIFGDGEYKDTFISEIEKYDNRMSILYHAPETNIINEYCKNSIFILTSEYEPFGLVIPEAMSCGLPVVSFDVPYGPSEIIHNGIDGFLIKPNNINDFVNKLSLLIENRELRCKMGKEAVKSSLKYSYNNIMPKWEQLFHSITHKM